MKTQITAIRYGVDNDVNVWGDFTSLVIRRVLNDDKVSFTERYWLKGPNTQREITDPSMFNRVCESIVRQFSTPLDSRVS